LDESLDRLVDKWKVEEEESVLLLCAEQSWAAKMG
jgi:hypothetical protein